MPRYIDADALLDDVLERYCKDCDRRKGIKNGKYRIIYEIGEVPCLSCWVNDMAGELEDTPTADVPDRKVGEWKPLDRTWGRSVYYCTNCGEGIDMPTAMGVPLYRFCPNCGSFMKGENDDTD